MKYINENYKVGTFRLSVTLEPVILLPGPSRAQRSVSYLSRCSDNVELPAQRQMLWEGSLHARRCAKHDRCKVDAMQPCPREKSRASQGDLVELGRLRGAARFRPWQRILRNEAVKSGKLSNQWRDENWAEKELWFHRLTLRSYFSYPQG